MNKFALTTVLFALSVAFARAEEPTPSEMQARMMIQVGQLQQALGVAQLQILADQKELAALRAKQADKKSEQLK